MKKDGIAVLPGGYDAASIKMIEYAGFGGAYLTGSGLHASLMGCPDMNMLTLTEVAEQVKRICQAVRIPVVVDAEEGFGGVH
ncbi:MAG: isocitrate lyase/phosphoenolpyruvate mutase family protein, partial [Lachnospiraceae bacterium]|nr:isocitrate lyase/phosphoenolpyruvate mutase family protein [Lachnospiraceae bacterium]